MTTRKICTNFAACCALCFAAMSGARAQSETYDYTAVVTGISGSGFGALKNGSVVTGTFTFDLAVPGVVLTPESQYSEQFNTSSGPAYSSPLSAALFNMTLSGGGYSYQGLPSPYSKTATLSEYNPDPGSFQAGDAGFFAGLKTSSPDGTFSQTTLQGSNDIGNPAYSANGLPVFPQGSEVGQVQFGTPSTTAGELGFTITSQTLVSGVPEPSTYAALLIGLGLVGFLARRRRGAAGLLLPTAILRV